MIPVLIFGIVVLIIAVINIATICKRKDFENIVFPIYMIVLGCFCVGASLYYYYNPSNYTVYTISKEEIFIDENICIERVYIYLKDEHCNLIKVESQEGNMTFEEGDIISLTDAQFDKIFDRIDEYKKVKLT